MIEFAYTECNLSIDQFFELSWYEWSLEVKRNEYKNKKRYEEWEGHASLTRSIMALLVNIHPNKRKGSKEVTGKDFIHLSFDDKEDEKNKEIKRLKPEEVDAKYSKFIKKNGG
jgi:hypothetical protein